MPSRDFSRQDQGGEIEAPRIGETCNPRRQKQSHVACRITLPALPAETGRYPATNQYSR